MKPLKKFDMYRIPWAFIALFLLSIFRLSAQSESKKNFSLQESLQFALEHSASIKNADLDIQIAQKRIKETKGTGLPQVSLSGDVTYFLEFPTSIIPASIFNPLAPIDQYVAFQFGLPMSSKAGFDVSQLLFSGEFLVGLQAAKSYAELSRRNKERTEQEVLQQVSKSYYLVLINQERVGLLDANIQRLEKILKDTKALNEQGFVEKLDVDRLSVSLSNLKIEKQKMQNFVEISLYLLKFQMGYPVGEPIQLIDKLNESLARASIASEGSFEKRPEYKLLQMQQKLYELDLRRHRAAYLPTLVAFGNFAYQGYRADFGDIFFQPLTKRFYPQSLVGLQLNVPIFKGLSQHARVEQAQLAMQKSSNDMANFKNAVALEVFNSQSSLNNSLKTLDEQKKNVDLATEVARVTRIKYEQGVGSNLEVVTAETELKNAQTNYLSTLYDALVARTDLEKANGTLGISK
jgi:outer membrane protein TolC